MNLSSTYVEYVGESHAEAEAAICKLADAFGVKLVDLGWEDHHHWIKDPKEPGLYLQVRWLEFAGGPSLDAFRKRSKLVLRQHGLTRQPGRYIKRLFNV